MKKILYFLLGLSLSGAHCLCQIDQRYPELCGRPHGSVPLPDGVAFAVDYDGGTATLFLGERATAAQVPVPRLFNELLEVCPLPGSRLLMFADNRQSQTIVIADTAAKSLVDDFYGFQPTISPDQRWPVFRKFYPRGPIGTPSEEYLLYDLQKTATENRPTTDTAADDYEDVGKPIFPLGMKNLFGDNLRLREDQVHGAGSNEFFWSADSKAVLFGDILKNQTSVIVVTIGPDGSTSAYRHTVETADSCKQPAGLPADYFAFISHAEVGPDLNGDRLIKVDFRGLPGRCQGSSLELHLKDFGHPTPEIHEKRIPTHGSVVDP